MKFLDNLFHHNNSQVSFSSISGYDDVENIINRVFSSDENFNLLLIGRPASAKTQFLMEIMKVYVTGPAYIIRKDFSSLKYP
jgi:stage III sporulation protein SpoIIIAA